MQPATGQAAWQIEQANAPKQRSGSITAIVRGAFFRGPDICLVHMRLDYTEKHEIHEIHEKHENVAMDPDVATCLLELVEKTALLRRDLQQKQDLERYAARVGRIEQKLTALTERIEASDPALAKALRNAWARPAMSLAYRNADHQKRQDDN